MTQMSARRFQVTSKKTGEVLTSFPTKEDYEIFKRNYNRDHVYPLDEDFWELREVAQ